MTDAWRRFAGLFVQPATAPTPSLEQASGARRATAVVVASQAEALTAGSALGLALLGVSSGGCATVATWTAGKRTAAGAVLPAGASARRTAAALDGRGLQARPTGRLVHVALPADEHEAAAAARRAAAVADGPAVVVLGAARTSAFDALLAASDLALVVAAQEDPALAALAARSLPSPPVVACCVLVPGVSAGLLARAGGLLAPSMRAALRPAIEAMS